MDEQDDVPRVAIKALMRLGALLGGGYVALWALLPLVAAVLTAILFVFASGLFTTKVVCRFERPLLIWGLVPVFGGLWLMIFWILFQVPPPI